MHINKSLQKNLDDLVTINTVFESLSCIRLLFYHNYCTCPLFCTEESDSFSTKIQMRNVPEHISHLNTRQYSLYMFSIDE